MGISVFPAPSAASKTRYVETLTSGTSWTVPAEVTYVNVTLVGGGGGGASNGNTDTRAHPYAGGGQIISTKVTTTPGASVSYSIGAGGAGAVSDGGDAGGTGGTTTFTGATSATGGISAKFDGSGTTQVDGISANNGGQSTTRWTGTARDGAAGGAGQIIIEYWV